MKTNVSSQASDAFTYNFTSMDSGPGLSSLHHGPTARQELANGTRKVYGRSRENSPPASAMSNAQKTPPTAEKKNPQQPAIPKKAWVPL